jgi:hypothetical protein
MLTSRGYIDGIHVTIYSSTMDPSWDMSYPLVNSHITMENHHAVNGKIHYFYGHAIAM